MTPAQILSLAKMAGFAVAILGLGALGLYVKHVWNVYQSVPALEQTIKDKQAKLDYFAGRTVDISNKLVVVQEERDMLHDQVTAYQQTLKGVAANLKGNRANAAAETNPICQPTDSDRQLRNSLINQLRLGKGVGQSSEASRLPEALKGTH